MPERMKENKIKRIALMLFAMWFASFTPVLGEENFLFDFNNNPSPKIQTQNTRRQNSINILDKKIQDKENQIKRISSDTKLSKSQKQAKISLIQREIKTLKTQKENNIKSNRIVK